MTVNWILKHALGSFLTELLSTFSPSRVANETTLEEACVSRAIDYIDLNIRKPIRVREVADAVGLSDRSLRRYFSKILGKTVVEVIRERKLNRSSTLLLMNFDVGSVSKVIAMEPSHFSRAFKDHYGVSPKNYQKAYGRQRPAAKNTIHCLPQS
jgi:AraC-like DNA-binding protein